VTRSSGFRGSQNAFSKAGAIRLGSLASSHAYRQTEANSRE
jgi:hypothetical protein